MDTITVRLTFKYHIEVRGNILRMTEAVKPFTLFQLDARISFSQSMIEYLKEAA